MTIAQDVIILNGAENNITVDFFFSIIIKPFWEMSMIKDTLWRGIWVGADYRFLQYVVH